MRKILSYFYKHCILENILDAFLIYKFIFDFYIDSLILLICHIVHWIIFA